ncbi:MAG: hypothetical protein ACYS18_01455 [Planctomycetota bacterium]|jgi:hypothetical protein
MTTQAQIIANRRNAQKSTGPRSQKGRATVSQNAVKHGLLARKDVIRSESQADFDLYRRRILDELTPDTPMESVLAERIVSLSWRLKRVGRIQNQTIDALNPSDTSSPLAGLTKSLLLKPRNDPHNEPSETSESANNLALGRLAIKDFTNARVLGRLLMYERRTENSLYKTIIELQRISLLKKLNSDYQIPLNQLTSRGINQL